MGRTKKTEKQTVFGLRTDHMSEEVYNHLEQKARSKKLATYIIQLVEQDLTQKEPFDAKRTSKSLKNQEQMMNAIKHITQTISDLQVAPVSAVLMQSDENTHNSLAGDLLKDVGQMGQLITNTNITGSLDEDDLEDPDF
jgi:vacuolar-type H+-ATPase catalytic subunit A/Vma1